MNLKEVCMKRRHDTQNPPLTQINNKTQFTRGKKHFYKQQEEEQLLSDRTQ